MNKNLQDLAWSVLPKEFKEEVKKEYRKWFNEPWWGSGYLRGRLRILRELFGEHNLTSDAEGEEMLTVSRKEVMNHFREACLDRIYYSNDSKDYTQATGRKIMLVRLFGKDKCLPDDKADEKVDDKADEKVPDENPSDIDSSEPNPAEPKFKSGDLALYLKKSVVRIIEYHPEQQKYYVHRSLDNLKFPAEESDLEPYTEPEENPNPFRVGDEVMFAEGDNNNFYTVEGVEGNSIIIDNGTVSHSDCFVLVERPQKESRNLSQSMSNCDKQLDNILKDSFRNGRRLNIATQIMSAILSNQRMLNNLAHGETTVEGAVRCIVDATMMYTDALIAECEKGGRHEKA